MTKKVLIVEDEIFVALEVEHIVNGLGHSVVGIAPDRRQAMTLCRDAEIALVDVNLRDGQTGGIIGRELATRGMTVIFMTANPAVLGEGVEGTVGVLTKPCSHRAVGAAIAYATRRGGQDNLPPPEGFRVFKTGTRR